MGSFYQHQERARQPQSRPSRRSTPVLALLEAHKAAWARLLEIENQTNDYEALGEAGRAADASIAPLRGYRQRKAQI